MSESEIFWRYSNRVYRCEGVQEACLALQNEHGLDINILLFSCWFGVVHGTFADEVFDQAVSYASDWRQNVVDPLRGARSWLKKELEAGRFNAEAEALAEFREDVKSLELRSEHQQQIRLEALVGSSQAEVPDPLSATVNNLRKYLASASLDVDRDVGSLLAIVLEAAVPCSNYEAAVAAIS